MVEDQALGLFIHYFQYMGFGITPMPTIFFAEVIDIIGDNFFRLNAGY